MVGKFLDFRGNVKYRPNRRVRLENQPEQECISEPDSPEKQMATLKLNALKSKLYLTVKSREGKNRLLECYLGRIQGILGA